MFPGQCPGADAPEHQRAQGCHVQLLQGALEMVSPSALQTLWERQVVGGTDWELARVWTALCLLGRKDTAA